jgi:hypothetical protein
MSQTRWDGDGRDKVSFGRGAARQGEIIGRLRCLVLCLPAVWSSVYNGVVLGVHGSAEAGSRLPTIPGTSPEHDRGRNESVGTRPC